MKRKFIVLLALCGVLALAACTSATSEPTAAATQTPYIMVVTATPETAAEAATLEPTLAATEAPEAAISITSVVDQGKGQILVSWDASGDFPSGFEVVWSSTDQNPEYPTDTALAVSDTAARSAEFQGSVNTMYYVRVCRLNGSTCDVYSNTGFTAVFAPTATTAAAAAANPPAATIVRPTATPAAPQIYIYKVKAIRYGTAEILWTAKGEFPNGFYILYSQNKSNLLYGEAAALPISDGSYRVATVTGNYYQTYYYKICRFTGTSCDSDSNIYTYTFTGPD